MKCQKCAKPALVHLTEVVHKNDDGVSNARRTLETHLCLNHAVEAGLLAPPSDAPPAISIKPESGAKATSAALSPPHSDSTTAIVQAPTGGANLPVARDRNRESSSSPACSICGLSWSQFKQSGLMGCPHDYEQFQNKLLPLLKRAQEGATEHIGKVPAKRQTAEGERQSRTIRLRRDLQRAINAENYEQAAQLRDKLRQLEQA